MLSFRKGREHENIGQKSLKTQTNLQKWNQIIY